MQDKIFMKMNVDEDHATKEEWDIYQGLLDNMMEEYPKFSPEKKAPDLLVYIDVNYNTMLKRIQKRGREFEQIDQDPSLVQYYKNLLKYYADWKKTYNYSPMLTIDGNKYDFVNNSHDLITVLDMIESKLVDLGNLTPEQYQQIKKQRKDKFNVKG